MQESKVAKAYASSLIQLGKDLNIDVAKELMDLNELIASSNNLENILFLDLFSVGEKKDVFIKISEKAKFSKLIENYTLFLLEERRMNLFPLIYKEVIVLDDHSKGFMRGTIEGAEETISEENMTKLKSYVEKELNSEVQLDYKSTEVVTAGYKVTVGDFQLDASIDNQLKKFKEFILG